MPLNASPEKSPTGAQQVQPLPYGFPRNQAQMREEAAMFAPMAHAGSPSSEAFVQNSPQTIPYQQNAPFEPAKNRSNRVQNERRVQRSASGERRARQNLSERNDQIRTLNLDARNTVSRNTVSTQAGNGPSAEHAPVFGSPGMNDSIPPLTSADLRT